MPVCAGRARLPRRVRHTQFRGMVGSACVLLTGGFWGTFSRGDHAGGWLPRLPPLPEQTPPGASQQVSAPPQPPQNSSLGGGGPGRSRERSRGCRRSRLLWAPSSPLKAALLWQPRCSLRARLGKKRALVLRRGEPVCPPIPPPIAMLIPGTAGRFSPPRSGARTARRLSAGDCGVRGGGGRAPPCPALLCPAPPRPALPSPARSPAGRAGGTSSAEARQPDPKCF